MLQNKYRVITFDLDDTLWQCLPVIERAELKLRQWLDCHYPKITEKFSINDFKTIRSDIIEKNPNFSHDFNIIRKTLLSRVASDSGYSKKIVDHVSNEGFQVFIKERSNVLLFDDVLATLKILSQHYILGALTNGNVALELTKLKTIFNFQLNSITAGISKPDIRFYQQACLLAKSAPNEIIHVGDNPIDDIQGARLAGFYTIWINRDNSEWPDLPKPNVIISSLAELPKLLLNTQ